MRRRGLVPPLVLTLLPSIAGAAPPPSRWVSAYDPALQVKPPTMKATDGTAGALVFDQEFLREAAAFRKGRARNLQAEDGMSRVGEVVIVEGSDELLAATDSKLGVDSEAIRTIARKVIGKYGDNFESMTLWLTFDDAASTQAQAYEFTVKADVRGIGMPLRDQSAAYGSNGVLRSILNMKRVWGRVRDETRQSWLPHLETWGQESGHRWMVFMQFRDRRTGQLSDALLGRDCSHYHGLVDTQNSVHDGFAWKDNGNGSFTMERGQPSRFGNLDLYGMGLLPADEVPPFFFIDVPGYNRPRCSSYNAMPPPIAQQMRGTRVDVGIEDVIAAEGARVPAADQLLGDKRQDYFREVQIVVTRSNEKASDPLPQQVAARIDKARLLWEDWMREATGNRMVVCTRVTGDCGDARSDVTAFHFNPGRRAPIAGPTTIEAVVSNDGALMASAIQARLDATVGETPMADTKDVGILAPGEKKTVAFALDLKGVACGTPVAVKASTQSDRHASRLRETMLVGTETLANETFEADAGWVVDPDKTDTAKGAVWERGQPQWTEIEAGKPVQPEGAHLGKGAFVTGAIAEVQGKETFARNGRTTLESPAFKANNWREPKLRYWVTFAAMQAGFSGGIEPSPRGRLIVQVRGEGSPPDGGADAGGWVEIDRLENVISPTWTERIVNIPEAVAKGEVKIRFVAEDANPQSSGVEAAIDDVALFSNLPACYEPPPDEGGCAITATRVPTQTAWAFSILPFGWIVAFTVSRRRRRARSASRASR